MSLAKRCGVVAVMLWASIAVSLRAAAVEVTIDDFSDAQNTLLIPAVQLLQTTVGSQQQMDSGVTGVIGGVRKLTLTASEIDDPNPMNPDNVNVGVVSLFSRFAYISSAGADGDFVLLYDRAGFGLNAVLSHAQGIKIDIREADPAAVTPSMKVIVTLNDGFTSVTASKTTDEVCIVFPCQPLLFSFSGDFPGVSPKRIFSVEIAVDPGKAGDMRLGPIETYGTPDIETICDDGEDNDNNGFTDCADAACAKFIKCINSAPLLTPGMIGVLVALLGTVGVFGLARSRSSH